MGAHTNPRPLGKQSARVWRAIGTAGVAGIGSATLYDIFRGVIDEPVLAVSLQNLNRGQYIVREGAPRLGVWRITEDCKVPVGETIPSFLQAASSDKVEDSKDVPPRKDARRLQLASAPKRMAEHDLTAKPTAEQSQRSQAGTAAARRFNKATAAPPAPLGWTLAFSPASVLASEVSSPAAAPAADAGVDIDKLHHCRDFSRETPATVNVRSPAPLVSETDFLCSLNSEGHLFILSDGRDMEIPIHNVRKLFRYLDLIRGTEPLKLLEALE